MPHEPWRSLTVRQLFPQLDANNPGSMLATVRLNIDKAKSDLMAKLDAINRAANLANTVINEANQALSKIDNVIDAISDTGAYITTITAVGPTDFSSAISHALADPQGPNINDGTAVGAVLIVATGPTLQAVNESLEKIKAPMQGLKL